MSLIVIVTIEGSVGSVGDTVMTNVLTSVLGGAGAGTVDVDLVARSSVITDVLISLMNGFGPGLVDVVRVVGSSINV